MRATVLLAALALAGCAAGPTDRPAPEQVPGFTAKDCNGITDADVARVAGASTFTAAVVNESGCFWQERSLLGTFGAGMGISTWWYRGSELGTERILEERAGRTVTEVSVNGNDGFKAFDANACSIYVAKGEDVITWPIQTMNPATLPPLCAVADELAELSQDRVN